MSCQFVQILVFVILFIVVFAVYYNQVNHSFASASAATVKAKENLTAFFETQESIYAQRRALLRKICTKYNMNGGQIDEYVLNYNILRDHQYKMAYCPNAKTGTSTWMKNFKILANIPEELSERWAQKGHEYMRYLYNFSKKLPFQDRISLVKDSLAFAFVRHPFVRLVSTFQDKVIDHNMEIWKKRLNAEERTTQGNEERFGLFVQYILQHVNSKDPHIESFWRKCDMCHIHYNVIGKVETAEEDNKYVITKLNMTDVLSESAKIHQSSGGSTEELAKKYFQTQSKEDISKLYEVYKLDFEMFGYDHTEYLDLGW